MTNQKRNFRFPIYNDDTGAKDSHFKSPYIQMGTKVKSSAKEIEVAFEEPKEDRDELKQQALYRKSDVAKAIKDNVSYNDLKANVTKNLSKFTTSTMKTAFNNYQTSDIEEKSSVSEEKLSKDNKIDKNQKTEYNSFANEPVESLIENKNLQDAEKIPLVKRRMMKSKELIEDSVPFHKKHKK